MKFTVHITLHMLNTILLIAYLFIIYWFSAPLNTASTVLHLLSTSDSTLFHQLFTVDSTLLHQLSATDSILHQLSAANSTYLHLLSILLIVTFFAFNHHWWYNHKLFFTTDISHMFKCNLLGLLQRLCYNLH